MTWSSHLKTLLITCLAIGAVLYAWVLVVDPYGTLWFSPAAEREPLTANQRFSYPALAGSDRFDSAIIGTSSMRLLRPDRLDPALGTSFASLAMNASTPYEQSRLLSVFTRHHPKARFVIFGVDEIWCSQHLLAELSPRFAFPYWLYDDNRWNDMLYLFNKDALSHAWSQFRNLLGIRNPRWGSDGYRNFLPEESKYDPVSVRRKLYGEEQPRIAPEIDPPVQLSTERLKALSFPNLIRLQSMLESLPRETNKVVIFPPYHQSHLPVPGSETAAVHEACKMRIVELAKTVPETTVIDFMVRSELTLNDRNYWDRVHYGLPVAVRIEESLIAVLANGSEGTVYRVLSRPL